MSDLSSPEWCLLCYSPVGQVTSDLETEKSLLVEHLRVIFLLKNCLELQDERLSYYLYKKGSPDKWLRLCSKCEEVVGEAEKIHKETIRLQRKLVKVKERIVGILKESVKTEVVLVGSKEYRKLPRERKKSMEISNLTRCFVKKHNYEWNIDPFRRGDLRAAELSGKLNPYAATQERTRTIGDAAEIQDEDEDIGDDDGEVNSDNVETSDSSSSSESDEDEEEDDEDSSDGESGKLKEEMRRKEEALKKTQAPSDGTKCSFCNKQFGTVELRHAHEEVHRREISSLRYKCPFCPQAFSRLDYYRIHLRSHKVHDKPKITKEDRALARAERNEQKRLEKLRKYPCTECDEAFPKLKLLEDHLSTQHEVAPVVCDLCGKSFARERSLKKHVKKMHETERKYHLSCPHCGMGMKSAGKLRKHLKEVHSVWEMDTYFCEVEGCKKKYQFRVDLEVHMAKHQGEAPYKCEFCFKDFWNTQQLRRHVTVIHSGNRETKPFKCSICNKGFALQAYVASHKKKVHFKKTKYPIAVEQHQEQNEYKPQIEQLSQDHHHQHHPPQSHPHFSGTSSFAYDGNT